MPVAAQGDAAARPGPRGPGLLRAASAWWGGYLLGQLALFLGVAVIFGYLGANLDANMERVGITPGFTFLDRSANFEIGEAAIPYAAGDTYGRAILVGLLNTVKVSIWGCLLATILGVALGVARLSSNPLLSSLVQGYVELVRNTPLLLQLFFWNATLHALPGPRQAIQPIDGVLLTNRGLFFPGIQAVDESWTVHLLLACAAAVGAAALVRRARSATHPVALGLLAALIVALVASYGLATGALAIEWPALRGFNIAGGHSVSPEFAALLIGLAVNSSASIAETVRGGILSVPSGQWEAGLASGLRRGQVLRLIVLPQALRVIIPVMTSSYLSLTKNSSLAVAIGFPDVVSILNTTANTTGQALETIVIMMAVYLALSLTVSVLMNWYNRRWALRELRPS
jgi:general L-amino acid transport system permease protein